MQETLVAPQTQSVLESLNPEAYRSVAQDFLRANRISEAGPADLAKIGTTLQAFVHIPYENLSKIIKFNRQHQDVLSLRMPDEVWDDFRRHRLGGTCFSLTFFLQSILHCVGYRCYPVMAHMKAGPNHHCGLVVDVEGEHFLVDPGYVLDIPLAIRGQRRRVFRTAHTGVEIRDAEQPGHFHVYTFNRENVVWRYEFADVPAPAEEFLRHWLASFHWNGMHGLCLTRVQKDTLIFVHNYFMRKTTLQGKKNHNLKKNREQVIQEIFGIRPEVVEEAEAARIQNLEFRS